MRKDLLRTKAHFMETIAQFHWFDFFGLFGRPVGSLFGFGLSDRPRLFDHLFFLIIEAYKTHFIHRVLEIIVVLQNGFDTIKRMLVSE